MRYIYNKTVKKIVKLIIKYFKKDQYVLLSLFINFFNTFSRIAKIRVLDIEWLDQDKLHFKQHLRKKTKTQIYGPNILNIGQIKEEVQVPEVNFYKFTDAIVSDDSTSVIVSDKIILERSPNVNISSSNFSSGQLAEHNNSKALVHISEIVKLDKGLFISGNGCANYFHWLIEILPKLEFLPLLDEQYKNYPLLISSKVKEIPTFKEALDLLFLKNPIIYLDRLFSYQVKHLGYITTPNMSIYNLRGTTSYEPRHFFINNSSIQFLRKTYLIQSTYKKSPSKIYFARKNKRRKFNDGEVRQLIESFGFKTIYMEDFSFIDQVNLMRNAEYIIGPSGASWTNIIFCEKAVKALCWHHPLAANFSGFSHFASLIGVQLDYIIVNNSEAQNTSDNYSSSYHIDINIIERWLDENLKEKTLIS